jgi:hypothetical protein
MIGGIHGHKRQQGDLISLPFLKEEAENEGWESLQLQ